MKRSGIFALLALCAVLVRHGMPVPGVATLEAKPATMANQEPPTEIENSRDEWILQLTDISEVALPGYVACAIQDPTYGLGYEQIRVHEDWQVCERTRQDSPSFGLARAAIWLRFHVRNLTDENVWYLQLMPNVDSIEFYQVGGTGTHDRLVRSSIAGRAVPYEQYEIKHRNHVFVVNIAPGEEATIYLRIQSGGSLWAGLSLYSRGEFLETEQREQFIFGAYFSALLVIALVNLFFLLATRKIVYVYYMSYLLSFWLLIFTLHGYSYQILWPASPQWNVHSTLALTLLTIACALLFTRGFLEYPRRSTYNRTIVVLIFALGGASLVASFESSTELWAISLPIAVLAVVMVFLGGLHRLLLGFRPATFFVAGWSMMALLLFEEALALAGLISFEYVSHYQVLGASALEMLFFTMALAYRHHLLLREKETAETALQQERDRMAAEIHDSLGSEITSIIVNLETRTADDYDGPRLRAEFARRLRTTLQKIRDIVYLMKNEEADRRSLSIPAEIQAFAERLSATGQYTIQCELSRAEASLDLKSRLHTVRIFEEWMTNIVRHTASRRIQVRWRLRGRRWYLTIRNDDAGFHWRDSHSSARSGARRTALADAGTDGATRTGIGLDSIRWRSRELGGRARALRWRQSTVFAVCIPASGKGAASR
jgi:signal transduction histidine kinase